MGVWLIPFLCVLYINSFSMLCHWAQSQRLSVQNFLLLFMIKWLKIDQMVEVSFLMRVYILTFIVGCTTWFWPQTEYLAVWQTWVFTRRGEKCNDTWIALVRISVFTLTIQCVSVRLGKDVLNTQLQNQCHWMRKMSFTIHELNNVQFCPCWSCDIFLYAHWWAPSCFYSTVKMSLK